MCVCVNFILNASQLFKAPLTEECALPYPIVRVPMMQLNNKNWYQKYLPGLGRQIDLGWPGWGCGPGSVVATV